MIVAIFVLEWNNEEEKEYDRNTSVETLRLWY